jgi:hypothetical protein
MSATAKGAAPARRAKPKAPASRQGRLGKFGWALLLGLGTLVGAPLVHAFWGDFGVLALGLWGLGFLMGRWTAR